MKRTFIAGLTCLVLLSAGLVHAGIIDDIEVEIWTDSNGYQNAHGVMRSARNSADSVQYLGCNRTAYKSGSEQTFCYAATRPAHSWAVWRPRRPCNASRSPRGRRAISSSPSTRMALAIA